MATTGLRNTKPDGAASLIRQITAVRRQDHTFADCDVISVSPFRIYFNYIGTLVNTHIFR